MVRKLAVAAAVTGLTLAFAASPAMAQKAAKKITFLTNYVFNGRHSPFFLGRDKGFYKEAGFDIEIQPATGSGFVISAVDGGKADYGMAESASVVQAVPKGSKVKGFEVYMDVTTSGLASLQPYPTPQSIAGKTVAASQTDSARVILPIIFSQKGLDPASIKWEAADPGVYFSLLLSGKADLITASYDGDVPALTKVAAAQKKEVHFASFADWGYDVFGYFLVARADQIAGHPDEVKAFAAATRKAVQYAIAHPEEAAQSLVKASPTLNYDTVLTQWTRSIKAIETPYEKEHGYGVATPDRLQRTVDLVKKALKIEAPVTAADVYATGLVTK
ncbi:MAG TPA: ABC transporter substrate-binding protein [Stellaceae bacterium]|nr:ABC transporter substrate-binding protein [Stellaceae bacterium]